MGKIEDRLAASLRFDAFNGDAHERGIAAGQVREAVRELTALRARVAELQAQLAALTPVVDVGYPVQSFGCGERTAIVNRGDAARPAWGVVQGDYCLNKVLVWEFEVRPSARDDGFYARCRWETAKDAADAYRAHLAAAPEKEGGER